MPRMSDAVMIGRLRGNHAALTGLVLDHAGLAEMRLQEVAEDAGDDVVRPAGEEADDELDRAARKFVGERRRGEAENSQQSEGKTECAHDASPLGFARVS